MAEQTQQQIIIHTQYIKDFSFENPNAPGSLTRNDVAPEIEINVNVTAEPQQQERVFEVVLTIRSTAKREEEHVFLAELAYAAVVSVSEDVEENIIHPLVMIEGPRLIFPFARQVLSDMTQAGGYMPLNIQPIDFVRLYQSGMENRSAEMDGASETVN
ncbi:MAG: protein-export chaperone SecB [Candidatus Puniceispirillales bacterium]